MTSQNAAEGENGGYANAYQARPSALDTSVAHPARIYDYWLGGKDNFAADRKAAEEVIAANPNILPGVRANRAFLGRAVRFLAGQAGIRQFLDIGSGPDHDHPHQIVSRLMDAVPPGSYLTVSDTTRDIDTDRVAPILSRLNTRLGPAQMNMRSRAEIAAYFHGLDLVEPGLVPLPEWRALANPAHVIPCYAGVARKP